MFPNTLTIGFGYSSKLVKENQQRLPKTLFLRSNPTRYVGSPN